MSAILRKKGPFFTKTFELFEKGWSIFFINIQYSQNRQYQQANLQSVFSKDRVLFESSKVGTLEKKGLLFYEKVSGKG